MTAVLVALVLFAIVFISLWAGYYTGKLTYRDKPMGVIRIDSSDPDGPYMFLEIATSVEDVMSRKYITLEVNTESYISQE